MIKDNAVQTLVEQISKTEKEKSKTYSAVVSHVDNEGVVWVRLAGAEKETPTASTSAEVKSGDVVNVEWRNNKLYIAGNYSNPSAGITRVIKVQTVAENADETAKEATASAMTAKEAAESAEASAQSAKTSADNAGEYASRALGNLSTVQSVAETLTWITEHGTMTLTSDTTLDPTHVYFIRDNNGDYTVGSYTYSIVAEPDVEDIGSYYELTIDESLNNYVGTHLALTSEGLWLLPASSGTNKVLIATGNGSTYTTAGTHIVDASGNVVASFRANGATIGENASGKTRTEIATGGMQIYQNVSGADTQLANIGYGSGNTETGTDIAPFFTLGTRQSGAVGNYSSAEGYNLSASGYASHAEGDTTTANGHRSHAEGKSTTASGAYSHAEGRESVASGITSHAEGIVTSAGGDGAHSQNYRTIASSDYQTALGKWNIEDNADTYAVIVGNGSTVSGRSNALTVDWNGNVDMAGHINSFYKITSTSITCPATAAHGYQSSASYTIPSEDRVSGYQLAGIVGMQSASSRIVPFNYYKESNTSLKVGFVNVTATATTSDVSVTFHLLWIKATSA